MTDTELLSRACPVCRADDAIIEVSSRRRAETMTPAALRPLWSGFFKERVFFSYARCKACGSLYAPHFFTDRQLAELYADMSTNMDAVPDDAIDATQRGYWDLAAAAGASGGGYLEIGPDVGHVVRHAVKDGDFDRLWLFEPNAAVHAKLAAAAGATPHRILSDMTDLSMVPDGSVGLAVMVHVVDHLLDPVAMLAQVRAKLKPGGTLMIVTHNEASALRHVMGTQWPPFCLQHPQIYSPRSMREMLGRIGFGSARVRRSRNYFPVGFMIRQAAWAAGIKLDRVPLPRLALGLKLGNIITIASRD